MRAQQTYLEGNAATATEYFQNLLGKQDVRIAYFGDHFWSDVHAAGTFSPRDAPKWDSIAVVEEFWRFDKQSSCGSDPRLLSNEMYWGDNYFLDQVPYQEAPVKNYFVAEMEKVARYAVPFAKNIKQLIK